MPYIIDGHNVIAAHPDLNLQDPDDEQGLIERVHTYCSKRRQRAIVFFDQGRFAGRPFYSGAWLQIRFVRPPVTADDAIRSELMRVGREAPNWIVVSSDREVQAAARRAGARVLQSESFARQLGESPEGDGEGKPDRALKPGEVKEWMELFDAEDDPPDVGGN